MEKREWFALIVVLNVIFIAIFLLSIVFYFGFNGISFDLIKDLGSKASAGNRVYSWTPVIFFIFMFTWPFFILLKKSYSFYLRIGLVILYITLNLCFFIFSAFNFLGFKQGYIFFFYLISIVVFIVVSLFISSILKQFSIKKEKLVS